MENKSHLTAISRKTLPKPTRWLKNQHLIWGDFLDYGCGRCHDINKFCILILKSNKDSQMIGSYVVDGYDPHYRPDGITLKKYNTIVCNYVLNVIEDPNERYKIISDIQNRLKYGGRAYLSVRNDIFKLNGKTLRGTWQGYIVLDYPIIHSTKDYILYDITK
jgi:2-polyprenyl-3-methyl-5-hydroxy-6-metoxy-1,4-benzoquinol methylase